jgi:hypothetical protein
MDYKKIYEDLISKARSKSRKRFKRNDARYVYYEKHHIVPKCLGGSDSKDNLVFLTGKEHFVAHKLLVEIYSEEKSLIYGLIRMLYSGENHRRDYKISSREYERLKIKNSKLVSERFRGIKLSESHKKKISKSHLGIGHTEETKIKLSKSHSGKNSYTYGKPLPKETRDKIRQSKLGDKNPMFGKFGELNHNFERPLSIEHRLKISELSKRLETCPHCGIVMNIAAAHRYHFNNCKLSPLFDISKHKTMKHSQESKDKISKRLKGRIFSEETKEKLRQVNIGKKFTDSHRNNLSKNWHNRKEVECPFCKKKSNNISMMNRWHFDNCKKNPNYIDKCSDIICPYCNFISKDKGMMKRWHFDNCKFKNE